MTDVHFSWKQLDGIVNPYKSTTGVVTITPISYNREDKSLVTDASSAKRVSGEYDFNLPPNSNGTFYQFELNPNGGSTAIEYRVVPDNPSIDYVDLPLVDKNADFVTDPSVPPWIAELEALKESGDFFVSKVEAALDVASDHSDAAGRHADSAEASSDAAKSSATNAGSSATSAKAAAEQARDAATLSQESALYVLPMLSGSVTITPQGDTLAVDLGQAVNVATGLAETSGAVDVTFPDVTTPDGRVNPDGLGTLLRVDAGADLLTWPGGTIVHGRPPTNAEAFASLVRVSGTVHVIWPAADSIPSQESGTNQVTKANLDDVLSGNITLEPGASVIASNSNPSLRGEWRFTNISDSPRSTLTLVNGFAAYRHAQDDSDFHVYIEYGPNSATKVSAALPTDGEIPAPGSGWMIVSASPTRFDYLDQLRSALGGMVTGSTLGDPKYPVALIIPHREGSMGDDGVFYCTFKTPADVFETTLSTDIPVGRSNADFETYGVKIHFKYLSPEDINRMGGWR